MKRSMFVFLSLLVIAALSACAPKGTPTPSVAELQAIAMANAQTQIALTAAAIPTATQLPPTPTPIPELPTEIPQEPIMVPTELAPIAPDPIQADDSLSSENPCNVPLSRMKGPHVDVTFNNTTNGNVSLYFYIYQTVFGCGVGNVSLAPGESVTTSVPKGCYDFYGWINGPINSTPAGYGCLDSNQTVKVKKDTLVFQDQVAAIPPATVAVSGISGTVVIGSTCPVVQQDVPCPDQPYPSTFSVFSTAGIKVAEFQTDAQGRFQISLPSGDYVLHLESPQPTRITADTPFTVADDKFTSLAIKYESGIL
jgi:hypothetical protein